MRNPSHSTLSCTILIIHILKQPPKVAVMTVCLEGGCPWPPSSMLVCTSSTLVISPNSSLVFCKLQLCYKLEKSSRCKSHFGSLPNGWITGCDVTGRAFVTRAFVPRLNEIWPTFGLEPQEIAGRSVGDQAPQAVSGHEKWGYRHV